MNRNIAMCIILSIVTCGIYGFYWNYKLGERLDIIAANNGRPASSKAVMFLILSLFGLGIVNYALAQSEINTIAG